jgi:hypothetical protein
MSREKLGLVIDGLAVGEVLGDVVGLPVGLVVGEVLGVECRIVSVHAQIIRLVWIPIGREYQLRPKHS